MGSGAAGVVRVMEEMLGASGFRVVNLGYPSTEATVEELLGYVDGAVAACGEDRVNFVTHSMGGILARVWLAGNRPERIGRVVMLAPPNAGSEVVDAFGDLASSTQMTGPAGRELGTDGIASRARAGRLRARGDRRQSVDQPGVLGAVSTGPDDGTVSVASTRVDGMADHIVLPVTHTFLMNNPLVIAQTVAFLRDRGLRPRRSTFPELIRRLMATR